MLYALQALMIVRCLDGSQGDWAHGGRSLRLAVLLELYV